MLLMFMLEDEMGMKIDEDTYGLGSRIKLLFCQRHRRRRHSLDGWAFQNNLMQRELVAQQHKREREGSC